MPVLWCSMEAFLALYTEEISISFVVISTAFQNSFDACVNARSSTNLGSMLIVFSTLKDHLIVHALLTL
jgi:hypothetical protein